MEELKHIEMVEGEDKDNRAQLTLVCRFNEKNAWFTPYVLAVKLTYKSED